MALELHAASHKDHVTKAFLDFIVAKFATKEGFFIETFQIPDDCPSLESEIYGPIVGDPPVVESEVTYGNRGGRRWQSRLIDKPVRPSRVCTVIAGPHEGLPCVLYTVYGGPAAPREPGDPSVVDVAECQKFWSQHALTLKK